jgi:hypothetical protein
MNTNLQPASATSSAPAHAAQPACFEVFHDVGAVAGSGAPIADAAVMETYDATSLDHPLSGEPAPGTHLVTQRRGYEHHGVYVGNGRVVHYAGFADSAQRAPVEEVTLECFARGQAMWVRLHPFATYTGDDAVVRARSRLGEDRYRLLTNNCEHFCVWCLFGEARSKQVEACLAHPRIAFRTVVSLVHAFLGHGRRSGRFAAHAA